MIKRQLKYMEKEEAYISDKAIDDALDFMERGDEMTDEEIEALMSDDDTVQSVGHLLDIKRATMESSPLTRIDADGEWEKFRTRMQPTAKKRNKYTLYYFIAGAAAAIVIMFGIAATTGLFKEKPVEGMVLQAVNNVNHPVLKMESGKEIELDGEEDYGVLDALGVKVTGKKEMKLTAMAEDTPDRLTLTIPRGQTYKLTLADGSEVWMNNDCRLVYPNRFVGKERRVKVEGEAYFKIAPDKKHPFIVEANGIEARVLGTEFNVRSYGRDDVHVTLIHGSVEVTSQEKHTARLTPGQDAKLNDDGSLGVAEVDIESYLYWRDGYFYFDDISLENIMQDIGRWYNLNVVFQNADARNYHMHFLADKRGGIDHVVKLLNSMGKVTVTLKDNTLMVR